MSKIFLTFCLSLFATVVFAQRNFDEKIRIEAEQLERNTTISGVDDSINTFIALIKTKDKNIWKAYYYAGLGFYKKGELLTKGGNSVEVKNTNTLAYKYVKSSSFSQPSNKDIANLLKLIDSQKNNIKD